MKCITEATCYVKTIINVNAHKAMRLIWNYLCVRTANKTNDFDDRWMAYVLPLQAEGPLIIRCADVCCVSDSSSNFSSLSLSLVNASGNIKLISVMDFHIETIINSLSRRSIWKDVPVEAVSEANDFGILEASSGKQDLAWILVTRTRCVFSVSSVSGNFILSSLGESKSMWMYAS